MHRYALGGVVAVILLNLLLRSLTRLGGLPATLLVASLVALAMTRVFGLSGAAEGTVILQLIMPAAVTNYLLAERYQTQPGRVAGLVVVSTLISVAAIPVALAMLL